jgi:hypothetical protein
LSRAPGIASRVSAAAAELEALKRLQYGIEPLEAYIARTIPKHGRVPKHLKRIVRLFEASRHREVRATISMPPRHGKTVTLGAGLSWRTVYDPACLNFYAGFADDLAKSTSRAVRRTTRDAGAPLSAEAAAVSEWRTLFDGGLKATSVGGSITGRGANGGVIVVDDAIKGREVAESLLQRDKIWDWFRADVLSRLEPGASAIVTNTRWHQDDIIGRLMQDPMGENWEHISLPAVGDEDGNPIDERLEPERAIPLWPEGGYDLARYAKIRLRGEYDWWSLYQGVPRPPGATLFPDEPERFDMRTFSWTGKRGLIVCDPAATAKTSSDYSAIAALAMEGYGEESVLHVVDVWRGQVTMPVLSRKLVDFQRAQAAASGVLLPVAVEAFGAFQAIPQMLRENAPGLRLLELGGDPKEPKAKLYRADKFTRAQPASKAWKGDGKGVPGGRIRIPHDAAWAHAWIQEHNDFTGLGDVHDDQVDTTAHGWNRLYKEKPGGGGGHGEEGADF